MHIGSGPAAAQHCNTENSINNPDLRAVFEQVDKVCTDMKGSACWSTDTMACVVKVGREQFHE